MSRRDGRKPRGIFERQQGSGVWWIRWADANGRLHREKIGPKNLAIAAYQARKTAVRQGQLFPNQVGRQKAVLFDELAQDFLTHSASTKRSHTTDQCRVRRLFAAFGGRAAGTITPQELRTWKASLLQTTYVKDGVTRPLSLASVKHHIGLLGAIFNLGIANAKVTTNPVKQLSKIKLNNTRVRYLTKDEEDRLFRALPAKYHQLTKVALLTGLRASNFLELEWTQIDLDAEVYTIPRTKSGDVLRLPMHLQIKEILAGLPRDGKYVFPGVHGRPIRHFSQIFGKVIRDAAIPNFRLHDLRHTWASRLAMAGVDLYTIQQLGGWKTIRMVERYAHLSPGHLRNALSRLPMVTTSTSTAPLPFCPLPPIPTSSVTP